MALRLAIKTYQTSSFLSTDFSYDFRLALPHLHWLRHWCLAFRLARMIFVVRSLQCLAFWLARTILGYNFRPALIYPLRLRPWLCDRTVNACLYKHGDDQCLSVLPHTLAVQLLQSLAFRLAIKTYQLSSFLPTDFSYDFRLALPYLHWLRHWGLAFRLVRMIFAVRPLQCLAFWLARTILGYNFRPALTHLLRLRPWFSDYTVNACLYKCAVVAC